ncbi:CBS domain containing protein [Balamuthia mandrillaris]
MENAKDKTATTTDGGNQASQTNAAAKRLRDLMVIDVMPERKVVFLEHSISVEDALAVLEDKNISSAPVVDLAKSSFLGFVDMLDVITFLLGLFPDVESLTPKNLLTLEWAGKHFAESPISEVLEVSKQYRVFATGSHPVKRETSLDKLVEYFWLGMHRVPVVNTHHNIINIVTQSDMLRFLAQNIHLIGDAAKKSLDSYGLGRSQEVISVSADDKVSHVLMQLNSKRISAVPVVDAEGKLVANFSGTDLKGLTKKNLADLLLPVKQFLEKRAAPEENFQCERSLHPLTVKPDASLEDAIFKLAATRVHRLYSVDEEGKPIGVVAITDLMKAFLNMA